MPITLSFGYDTERPYGDLAKTDKGKAIQRTEVGTCEKLTKLFDREKVPRTFFILGSFLESCADHIPLEELRSVFDKKNSLTEIQQHSYSHQVFRPIEGRNDKKIMTPQEFGADLEKANQVLEDILIVKPTGLRTPLGYPQDLTDQPGILAELQQLGFRYVSSDLRGTSSSYRAFLTKERQPHTYAHVGFSNIVEIPSHGWQDAIFTVEHAQKMLQRKPDSADEIVAHYSELFNIAETLEQKQVSIALCLHPWAVAEYDPQLEIHKHLVDAARNKGIRIASYGEIAFDTAPRTVMSHDYHDYFTL